MTGFDSSFDFTVNTTGGAGVTTRAISGSGAGPYTITLSNITGNGTVGFTVRAGVCTDASGNSNLISAPSTKCIAMVSDGSLATTKGLADNASVYLGNKALYLKNGTYGYIEEQNRFSGIRIEGTLPVSDGQLVWLAGTMKTSANGERYIQVDNIANGASYALKPLGMNNRDLADRRVDGIYVTAWQGESWLCNWQFVCYE